MTEVTKRTCKHLMGLLLVSGEKMKEGGIE